MVTKLEVFQSYFHVTVFSSLHITRRRPVERSETQWERSGTGRSGAVEWREVTRSEAPRKRSERNHGGHKDSDSLHSSPSRRRSGSAGEAASDVRRRDEPGRDVMDGEEWSGNNNPKAVIIAYNDPYTGWEASVRLGHKTLRTWMKNSSLW